MSLVSISDLNGPQQHVVELINVAKQLSDIYDDFLLLEQKDEGNRAPGIHASELYPCMRKAVYSVMGTEKKPMVPKFWLQRFKVGTAIHGMLQNDFHRMAKRSQMREVMRIVGSMTEELDLDIYFEDESKVHPNLQPLAAKYQIHSSSDGIFTFVDRQSGMSVLRVGLEIKTASPGEFQDLKAPKPEHVRQAHLYMACLDLPLMWFFYMNKGNQNNTNSKAPYLVVWQPNLWAEIEARCQQVLQLAEEKTLPSRYECPICEFCPWSWTCNPSQMRGNKPAPFTRDSILR